MRLSSSTNLSFQRKFGGFFGSVSASAQELGLDYKLGLKEEEHRRYGVGQFRTRVGIAPILWNQLAFDFLLLQVGMVDVTRDDGRLVLGRLGALCRQRL
ncbi:hypothetical protein L6452_02489 [Arctium lappa]|uniref:Uncharacterized protein n=1 Tax=Arctium lappa TaxID=4217 RepID=A0ACB9FL32_ARCLA|nr:hypothetical protein L6452_02489 [Arctium lappa]